jgi:hypothetical protein
MIFYINISVYNRIMKVIQFDSFKELIKHGVPTPCILKLETRERLQTMYNQVCPSRVVVPFEFKQSVQSWRAPVFKATTALKKELSEDEQILNNIRGHLNKLSSKNYLNLLDKIKEEINKFQTIPPEISKFILDISISNTSNILTYSDLYADLSNEYPILKSQLIEKIRNFTDVFDNIEYISEQEDYTGFCKTTTVNKNRRAFSDLLSYLAKYEIIEQEIIRNIIQLLIDKFLIMIHEENKINETDEIIENLLMLVKGTDVFTIICNEKTIMEYITEFSKYKYSRDVSLSNKSIFKCKDFVDLNNKKRL